MVEPRGSAAELALLRAAALQPSLGAFAELTPQIVAERAGTAGARGPDGGSLPLDGMPLGVKDVIDVAGAATRLGTPGAGHRTPEVDARVVDAAIAAGAAVVGKTTTHELALGLIAPQTRNPLDTDRIAGGSSGGSAVAVAAGIAPAALGTDSSGSVRCPAALCGVVGLKPTLGAIPMDGVAPLAPSQDTVGVIAATADACAAVLQTVAGCVPRARDDVAGLRIGIDRRACERGAAPAVASAVLEAAAGLERAEVEIVDIALDELEIAAPVSAAILFAEAARIWGEWLERDPHGLGPEARGALRAGGDVPPSAYRRALRARAWLCARMRSLYLEARLDAVLAPTVAVTAPVRGASRVDVGGRPQAVDAALARYTSLASVSGQPALSVPCGLDEAGLPIGLQAIGRPGGEQLLLDVAAAVERLAGARTVAAALRRRRAVLAPQAPAAPSRWSEPAA